MAAAQNGDQDAYNSLLSDLYGVTEAYLARILGPSFWREDCVQDCLTAIHRARHSYDPRRPFRPWFFTIVRHKAIDALRRDARRPEDLRGPEAEASETSSVEQLLDTQQLLNRLGTPYRDALVLTKVRGYSIAEAASAAGVSSTAMKSRVHRAVRQLKRLVESELETI
jgi:RNA polymerase sigma-70 factor (ECF subfamily)